MNKQQKHVDVSPRVDQLARFRAWSVWCGHYAITDAVDRFQVLEDNGAVSVDHMLEQVRMGNRRPL